MKSIYATFLTLLAAVILAISCKQQQSSEMITESKAVELAKKEFTATGREVEDYRVTIETDSSGRKWIVWFDKKGAYATPGGKHAVTVEKASGKTAFMPGE